MRVTIYAGSSSGNRPVFAEEAGRFAARLAQRGCEIVYGGGSVGLMGVIADAALANGGKVTGVIPRSLVDAEVAHTSLTELRVVGSMQERKAMMEDLGDCFVALPGGVGTLEELFEVWAGLVLGHHRKPLMLLDTAGYWNRLVSLALKTANYGFMSDEESRSLVPIQSADDLFVTVSGWTPPRPRWTAPSTSRAAS
ncbi:LOG family protein [Streptomyces sp. NPDC055808]